MSQTIKKVTERHTAAEMMKRDGETYMAVGLFLVALSIPVIIGTFYALARPHAAIVNCICGVVLLAIGAGGVFYGWSLYRRTTKKAS